MRPLQDISVSGNYTVDTQRSPVMILNNSSYRNSWVANQIRASKPIGTPSNHASTYGIAYPPSVATIDFTHEIPLKRP